MHTHAPCRAFVQRAEEHVHADDHSYDPARPYAARCVTVADQIASLRAARDAANDEIDAAYWRFSRMRRAAPPVLAVPGAYAARKAAEDELRAAPAGRCACGEPLEDNGPGRGVGCSPCMAVQEAS